MELKDCYYEIHKDAENAIKREKQLKKMEKGMEIRTDRREELRMA